MRMKTYINRVGSFTVPKERCTEWQCGSKGTITFNYQVEICSTNRTLDGKGFIVDNKVIDDYFQNNLSSGNKKIKSCELIAEAVVKYFRRYFDNHSIDLEHIKVTIAGSPHSKLTAEWYKSAELV